MLWLRWWTCTSRQPLTGHLDPWVELGRSMEKPRCPSQSRRTSLQRWVINIKQQAMIVMTSVMMELLAKLISCRDSKRCGIRMMINNIHHQVGVEPGSRLKRRSSERQKRSKGVQFEDQQAVATPWWNYPIKLMRGATNTNTTEKSGANSSKRRRRRHYTDPESRNVDDDKDENGDVKGWGGFEIPFFWPAAFFGQKNSIFVSLFGGGPGSKSPFVYRSSFPACILKEGSKQYP